VLALDWRVRLRALLLLVGAWIGTTSHARAIQSEDLVVGHWLEVKGELDPEGRFVASAAEVLQPEEQESIVGIVTKHARRDKRFWILSQSIEYSEKTSWLKVAPDDVDGKRVKVEGFWRGPLKFSARSVALRPEGRDRLTARVDSIVHVEGGRELSMIGMRVFLPSGVAVEAKQPMDTFTLAPQRKIRSVARLRDDDDYIPGTHVIANNVMLGLRLEWNGRNEDEYDLNGANDADRLDNVLALRGEITWLPSESFYGLLGFRGAMLWRDDEKSGYESSDETVISEAYGYFRGVLLSGLDLQIGRQDFDEKREWLYDQNMDAARAIYSRDDFRAELSASTNYSDAPDRDEHTNNLIAYVSNNDPDRTFAAYVIDRRDDRSPDYYPIHFGARALGEWIPGTDGWLEYSVLRGYRGTTDLRSYGFDVGLTWEGRAIEPWYLTSGWAFGSGDDDPDDNADGNFFQTGLQDNNDKFGGVTSFRYYGEVLDPELSNLTVFTLGVGRRIGHDNSIDLIWHRYFQNVASSTLFNDDLDRNPAGLDTDLGWEVDLVAGSRAWSGLDLELVVGTFDPGKAFPEDNPAWLVALQARLRL
jgi:alginate production protein